ncbi:MAG: hypothetical protein EXR57_03205 [Dehalococcoidia bacterium]|nr:hypothetical protein [Dehalococcoidia bacterium]MSQ34810.1 hypothetical protein [Dehalococcoidia bacterium]
MTQTTAKPRVADVIRRLGRCVELVSSDPNFKDITVGLYLKGATLTFWTFSSLPGAQDRIRQIRDRAVLLTGMEPVPGTHNEARLACGDTHRKAMRFMASEAVERKPDREIPSGAISVKDTKSHLVFFAEPSQKDGRWIYKVTAQGHGPVPQAALRVKAVVGGFMRYGDCQRVSEDQFAFPCGARHDQLARLLISYARNVSAVETMMAAADLAGQMTTQTLGFAQN